MLEYPLCNIWRTTVSWSAIAQMPPGFRQAAHRRSGKAKGLASASGPPEPVARPALTLQELRHFTIATFGTFRFEAPAGVSAGISGAGASAGVGRQGATRTGPCATRPTAAATYCSFTAKAPTPGKQWDRDRRQVQQFGRAPAKAHISSRMHTSGLPSRRGRGFVGAKGNQGPLGRHTHRRASYALCPRVAGAECPGAPCRATRRRVTISAPCRNTTAPRFEIYGRAGQDCPTAGKRRKVTRQPRDVDGNPARIVLDHDVRSPIRPQLCHDNAPEY
jgi:hypothetical protein